MLTKLRNLSGDDIVGLVIDGELSVAYRAGRQCWRHRKLVVFLVGVLFFIGVILAVVFTLKKPKSVSKGM